MIANPARINTNAKYVFFMQRGAGAAQIPANSNIRVTFPNDYALADGAYGCSNQTGIDSTLTCSVASNVLTVSNGYAQSKNAPNLRFEVLNLRNPGIAAATAEFKFEILDFQGVVIGQNNNTLVFTPEPGELTSMLTLITIHNSRSSRLSASKYQPDSRN